MKSEPPPSSDDLPRSRPTASTPHPEIAVQNAARAREVQVRPLRSWLSAVLRHVAPTATSFTLRCTSDREMRTLNRSYRGKDKSTDVLSFPGDLVTDPPGEGHLGDVVIAVPTARRQAKAAGHSVQRELHILTLHGVLHCLGYDHETDDGQMEALEHKLRRRWLDDLDPSGEQA